MSNTVIQLKKSAVPGNIPSSLADGEIAINTADGILFYKDPSNVIRTIQSGQYTNSYSTLNVNSSLLIATSNDSILSIDSVGAITLDTDILYDRITVGVKSASTSEQGVVQLYDGFNSKSTVLAATANSVNAVYEYISTIGVGGNLTTNYKSQEFVAVSGQTTFLISGGYTPEYISVYINGVLLSSSDFTANNGTSVILSIPATIGDSVVVNKWFFDNSIYLTAIQKVDEFTCSANQTSFTTSAYYDENNVKVYRNGVLLEKSAYTASSGTELVLSSNTNSGDIVSIEYWGTNRIEDTPVYIAANNAIEVANSKIDKLEQGDLTSGIANTTLSSANQVLDLVSTSIFRSAKYFIQVSSGTDYQASEVVLLHNDIDSFVTEYGLVASGNTLMTFDSDILSGNARLLMTPLNSTNQIKFVKTVVTV